MRPLRTPRSASIFAAALLLLAGCKPAAKPAPDSASTPPTVPEPSGTLITAKTAYAPMYKYALGWSDDILTLNRSARAVPGFQNTGGRAAQWVATGAWPH